MKINYSWPKATKKNEKVGGISMSELCMGPYERRYYRLGAPVRETVRQAQENMANIWHSYCNRMHRKAETCGGVYSLYPYPPPIQYPKSLGELCIEVWDGWLHQRALIRENMNPTVLDERCFGRPSGWWYGREVVPDLRGLRRAMWHRGRA